MHTSYGSIEYRVEIMGLDILFDTDGAVLTKPLVSLPVDAAREANHRIANVLTLLSSSVRLQATNAARKTGLTGNEVRLLLAKIAAQIEAAGQLHKWLCSGTAGKEMGLNEYLHKLCAGWSPLLPLLDRQSSYARSKAMRRSGPTKSYR